MSDELPPDVRGTLTETLEAAAEEARTRDADSVRARLDSVETLAEEVPAGSGRERLRHGVRQVRKTVENEPLVAAEYLTAMQRLVDDGEADGDAGDEDEGDDEEDGDGNGDANPDDGRDVDPN